MKVTNYENSKRLAELRFKAETACAYKKWKNGYDLFRALESRNDWEGAIPAYDLETILDALPKSIQFDGETFTFRLTKNYVGYHLCTMDYVSQPNLEVRPLEGESLADTAVRLLIELHEQGLIKFGESND